MQHVNWRKRRYQLTGTLWLVPALCTAGAILSGGAISHFRPSRDSWLGPVLFLGSPDEARRLLLTCATSILGVMALLIGLTMVAVQTTANRYSPRLLRNFVRDWTNQLVLGVFVGSFTFNAAGLYTVGLEPGEIPRLAITLGLCSLFFCIAAMVFYIDRMVHIIQIDQVLATVGINTTHVIADCPPGVGRSAGQGDAVAASGPPGNAIALGASKSGYIQYVHTPSIVAAAARCGCTCLLSAPVGGHVVAETPLAWIWPADGRAASTSELVDVLNDAVHIGFERTRRQDVALGITQIIDIAVRCMHDFDFHTAVQATNELARLMCKLAPLPLGAEIFRDGGGAERLIVPARGFADYLDLACGMIMRLGAAQPVVLIALLNMLRNTGSLVTAEQRRSIVGAKVDEVVATATRSVQNPVEVAQVQAAAEDVKRRVAPVPFGAVDN